MKTYFKLTLSMVLCLAFTFSVNAQQEQYGQASYYSDAYHGKKTASGQKYDKNKMTAAHNDYPFGSTIKVTHLENKKSVTVKVIDRGPYIKGRIVDLSRAAAQQIGLINDGVAEVKVELVRGGKSSSLAAKGNKTPSEYSTVPERKSADNRKKVEENIKKKNAVASTNARGATPKTSTAAKKTTPQTDPKKEVAKKEEKKTEVAATTDTEPAKLPLLTSKGMQETGLYQISLLQPKKIGYGVQVASFNDYENVVKKVADLQSKFFQNIIIKTENADGANVYKIILGQYETREQANSYKKNLKRKKKVSGFVVPLGEEE